ncbi:VQ motif-containing protein 22-like [Amaranthus tricolor]|uniref:VQ motif-containing protein 22-like n=1 Tax=Amaranthus tricolor TaxID=29722 RepID=UPI00258468E3|nr:VQ motif-containing protein 22-like [Amaranthus tricolor]
MTSTSDWLNFHQSSSALTDQAETPYSASPASDTFFSGRASDPTTSTMSPNTTSPQTGPAQLGPSPGRVNKPVRKRTRASRRTPTTLLNTDTTNFRAMVQQFTGGPSNNFDISGPGSQIYGQGYGIQLPVAQIQQQIIGPVRYSISSSNDNNNNDNMNIMLMQRMGEVYNTNEGRTNTNVNMSLNGPNNGSSSSENRSNTIFHF